MVTIKKINDTFSISLVGMLNNDNLLQHALGSKNNNISKEEFIKYNNEWCKNKNAEIFAILLNNTPIGMISLSHQDTERQSAQLGYWIVANIGEKALQVWLSHKYWIMQRKED